MSSSCTSSSGLNTILVFAGDLAALVDGVVVVIVADGIILGGGSDADNDVVILGTASSPSSGISGVSTNFNPSANALGFCEGWPPSLAA